MCLWKRIVLVPAGVFWLGCFFLFFWHPLESALSRKILLCVRVCENQRVEIFNLPMVQLGFRAQVQLLISLLLLHLLRRFGVQEILAVQARLDNSNLVKYLNKPFAFICQYSALVARAS